MIPFFLSLTVFASLRECSRLSPTSGWLKPKANYSNNPYKLTEVTTTPYTLVSHLFNSFLTLKESQHHYGQTKFFFIKYAIKFLKSKNVIGFHQ
jgi:hypothetical protein